MRTWVAGDPARKLACALAVTAVCTMGGPARAQQAPATEPFFMSLQVANYTGAVLTFLPKELGCEALPPYPTGGVTAYVHAEADLAFRCPSTPPGGALTMQWVFVLDGKQGQGGLTVQIDTDSALKQTFRADTPHSPNLSVSSRLLTDDVGKPKGVAHVQLLICHPGKC